MKLHAKNYWGIKVEDTLRNYLDKFAYRIGFQSFNDMGLATLCYGGVFAAAVWLIWVQAPKMLAEDNKRAGISSEIVKLVDTNKDAYISLGELEKLEEASYSAGIKYSIKSSSLRESLEELPLSDLEKLLNHLN